MLHFTYVLNAGEKLEMRGWMNELSPPLIRKPREKRKGEKKGLTTKSQYALVIHCLITVKALFFNKNPLNLKRMNLDGK